MTERNTGSLTRRTLTLTEDDNEIVASWVTDEPTVVIRWLPVDNQEDTNG